MKVLGYEGRSFLFDIKVFKRLLIFFTETESMVTQLLMLTAGHVFSHARCGAVWFWRARLW